MVILITGTSRGLGKYIAEQLLEEGHTVYGCNTSGEPTIHHDKYKHFKTDVRSETDVKKMIKEIRMT